MFKHSGRWVKAIRAARFLHAPATLPPWRPAQVLDEYVRSVLVCLVLKLIVLADGFSEKQDLSAYVN